MIDTHTHILPGLDDGAVNIDESIALLKFLHSQGVTSVAATPHFKPITRESIDSFIERRNLAEAELRRSLQGMDNLPTLNIGAEVTLSVELPDTEGLDRLCYQNGNFILIELDPFSLGSWIPRALYEISNRLMLIPVIAHIDRYLGDVSQKLIDEIIKLNCPIQFNASALNSFSSRHHLLKLMKKHSDTIFVVGSDCHRPSYRPPFMDVFEKKAIKYLGYDFFEEICENSQLLLTGELIT